MPKLSKAQRVRAASSRVVQRNPRKKDSSSVPLVPAGERKGASDASTPTPQTTKLCFSVGPRTSSSGSDAVVAASKPTLDESSSVSANRGANAGTTDDNDKLEQHIGTEGKERCDDQKAQGSKPINKVTPAGAGDQQQQQQLSRGQRKRQAKRDQYLRKEQMVLSSLKLKKAKEQAQRIDGLDALKEALLATVVPAPAASAETSHPPQHNHTPNLLRSNRGRQKLVAQEVEQMNLVLQHPAYQADPLATLREHLQNSMAAAPAGNPLKSSNNKTKDNKNKKDGTSQSLEPPNRKKHRKTKYRATRSRKR